MMCVYGRSQSPLADNIRRRAIAGGDRPHVHLFRRNPDMTNLEYMSHTELPLPPTDIFSMSSFDNTCVVGEYSL
jgi:hypothetical protein